jgi:hypothetical protein
MSCWHKNIAADLWRKSLMGGADRPQRWSRFQRRSCTRSHSPTYWYCGNHHIQVCRTRSFSRANGGPLRYSFKRTDLQNKHIIDRACDECSNIFIPLALRTEGLFLLSCCDRSHKHACADHSSLMKSHWHRALFLAVSDNRFPLESLKCVKNM